MDVGKSVYLSSPGDLPGIDSEHLGDSLRADARAATRIWILTGYFGKEGVLSLLSEVPEHRRQGCSVRLVFGFEGKLGLTHAVKEMRDLGEQIRLLGFEDAKLLAFGRSAHFHTKVYHFLRGTRPVWFVGSANASGAFDGMRHEMMLRLSGRHEGLYNYAKAVIASAHAADNPPLQPDDVRDLRSFFLAGRLCFEVKTRVSLAFEACSISSENRDRLKAAIGGNSNIPHAEADAEGFKFSLVSALRTSTAIVSGDAARASFRPYAVETTLGYWLPRPYAEWVEERLHVSEAAALKKLEVLSRRLLKTPRKTLDAELHRHVQGLREFFGRHTIKVEPRDDLSEAFTSFLESRTEWLGNAATRQRMVRRLAFTDMVDIWNDPAAAREFEEAFLTDVAFRLGSPSTRPHVVKALAKRIALGKTAGIPIQKLRARLEAVVGQGWSRADWPAPKGSS